MTPSKLPPPIPDGLSPDEQQDYLRRFGLAQNVKHKTGAIYLRATACETLKSLPLEGFVEYVDQLMVEAGEPKDPIERLLIEQIGLAHHNIGRLYIQASSADTLEQAKVYNAAATRLLAEFRRAALALKKYREPTPTRNITLVKQQNLAQHQQVALVESKAAVDTSQSPASEELTTRSDNQLASKKLELEYAPPQTFIPQPESHCRREAELVEAKRPHR
jgi:hypothetical protein